MKTLDEFMAELRILRYRHCVDIMVIDSDGDEVAPEFNDDGADAIVIE